MAPRVSQLPWSFGAQPGTSLALCPVSLKARWVSWGWMGSLRPPGRSLPRGARKALRVPGAVRGARWPEECGGFSLEPERGGNPVFRVRRRKPPAALRTERSLMFSRLWGR